MLSNDNLRTVLTCANNGLTFLLYLIQFLMIFYEILELKRINIFPKNINFSKKFGLEDFFRRSKNIFELFLPHLIFYA